MEITDDYQSNSCIFTQSVRVNWNLSHHLDAPSRAMNVSGQIEKQIIYMPKLPLFLGAKSEFKDNVFL